MNLFELNSSIAAALDALVSSVNEETGEVDDKAVEALEALQVAREEKLENTALYMKGLQAEADALKREEDTLKKRRETKEKALERLKAYITDAMLQSGDTRLETARVVLSFRKSEAVNITNIELVPKGYWKSTVKTELDKTKIKEALKSGKEVNGAELQVRQNLQIK